MAQSQRDNDDARPYLNLFSRLSQYLPEYAFDSSITPFHSSYDNWHVFGHVRRSHANRRCSDDRMIFMAALSARGDLSSSSTGSLVASSDHVVARVTQNTLRIEREYKQAQMLYSNDSDYMDHFAKPLRLVRMPAQKPGEVSLVVSVTEAPSLAYMDEMATLKIPFEPELADPRHPPPTLSMFLEFAIGACASLEVLHHRYGLVHGEIRMDAFHFDQNTSAVRMINLGSGVRTFTSRLTSSGWTSLLSERGIKYKLQFFAPEQTGRLATEPDTRTDIYALGVGFWALLTGAMPFRGSEALEIIQSVLSQHLPSVQAFRSDIPDAVAMVITKMTKKAMTERYNSIFSAKHDLIEIRSLLSAGHVDALNSFKVAQNDVSASFSLPTKLVGRKHEAEIFMDAVNAASQHITARLSQASTDGSTPREMPPHNTDALRSASFSIPTRSKRNWPSRRSMQDQISIDSLRTSNDFCKIDILQTTSEHLYTPDDCLTHIISISGERGIGKTYFLRNLQQTIRRTMVLASAQFERTKTQPLEPILKLISSLFRQMFSEPNVNSPSHEAIRQQVGPYWESIHAHLELPPWLLEPTQSCSDSTRDKQPRHRSKSWLDGAGSNQASRFMQVLLQVLKVIAYQRLLCLCLDDLCSADEEGLNLVQALAKANLPLILVVIHKPRGQLGPQIEDLTFNATKCELGPLSEEEVGTYVGETFGHNNLQCPTLATIVYDRTGGAPSYVRDFLEQCHASGMISFSWRNHQWEIQLEKVAQCWPRTDDPQSSLEMTIFLRFRKLHHEVQSMLSWAAVIGHRFSFTVLQALSHANMTGLDVNVPLPMKDVLGSLQHAVSKFIIRATDDDDVFEFSDENAYSACWMLARQYNTQEMHYVIARAMLPSTMDDSTETSTSQMYGIAEHILKCLSVISSTGGPKQDYSRSLLKAAEIARATGALHKSASYCDAAMQLVVDSSWSKDHTQLFIRAAEVYHLVGRTDESLDLLAAMSDKVDGSAEKIPTIIIRSRIHGAQGDGPAAFQTIYNAILDLHSSSIPATLEQCDQALLEDDLAECDLGASNASGGTEILLAEAVMTALFMSEIVPYQCAIALIKQSGTSTKSVHKAIGLLYLSAVALFRLKARSLMVKLRDKAMTILAQRQTPDDVSSRTLVLRTLLLGHLESENSNQILYLTHALESSNSISDRGFLLLNIATIAMLRLASSDNFQALEVFIEQSTMDLSSWMDDYQNSLLIVSVRQMARAMRGATEIHSAATILCDDEHDTELYLEKLKAGEHNFCYALYQGCRVIIMNLFGFAKEAMEIGITLMPYINECRFSAGLNLVFYHTALAIASVLRMEEDIFNRAELLGIVAKIRGRIELIARSKAPVCQAWLLVLEAEIADDTSSLRLLNFAVEIVQDQHFALDEAYCLELYINCLARMGAISAVLQLALRCEATYEQVGASAKAEQIRRLIVELTDDSSNEPSTTMSPLNQEALRSLEGLKPQTLVHPTVNRLRTDSFLLSETLPSFYKAPTLEPPCTDDTQSWLDDVQMSAEQVKSEAARVLQARQSANPNENTHFNIGTLDVIDLHSIISSSQAMTSELRIDRLLQTLTKIIADSTAAEVCSIVIEDDNERGWIVAATQTSHNELGEYVPTVLEDLDDPLSKQINTYVLRFREQVFIHNTKESDTFGDIFPNLSSTRQEASIICMPMLHSETLLGSLYCQAGPNTFTDRTMTLVQLLVTQISISLHNAILFKQLEQASNNNLSMIELQKDTVKRAQQSEKKARMAELKAVENLKQKEEAMKAKSMFLANVSHELRTPLNGVIGMTTILQDTQLTAQQLDCCHNVRVCAETLVQIVNDILDYNKLEAGKMMVSNAPMNVRQTLSEVVTALRATHTQEDIETVEQFDVDGDMMLMGDSVRLQQVLMNLMSNAYKFTPSGKITVSANIEQKKADSVVLLISVADSGIGISEEQQKKLFMPFSQADASTARSYGGTGLGLSICKSIVEGVLKGQIWLHSVLGEGTKVSFRAGFRLADADAKLSTSVHHAATAYAELNDAAQQRKCLHLDPANVKICIAEDNAINRKIAMTYVKKLGYKYEAYEDGKQAVDALVKSKDFHVVLMDVQMPVLDGYDATRALRRDENEQVRNVIIIAMTASTIQGDKERCFQAGMDAYVAKPVRLETLRDAIQSFIAKAENKPSTPDHGSRGK